MKLLSLLSLFFISVSQAGIIQTYSDKSQFLSLNGANNLNGSSFSLSTSHDPLALSIHYGQWSTLISGNEYAISGSESLGISLSTSANAFGFEFHEPSATQDGNAIDDTNTPYFYDSTFTLELFSGSTLIDSILFTPNNDELVFLGFITDELFDLVRFTEHSGGTVQGYPYDINNDNEFYGQFYASSNASVPEPSIIALMGLGILGLALSRRKMKK